MFLTLLRIALIVVQVRNSDIENIGRRDINRGLGNFNATSMENEVGLGRQLAAEFDRRLKFLEDSVINEYINRVARNLVLNSDAQIPITIRIVDSDEVNASSLPGGFVYINSGLVAAADSEAELASVIAHAIAQIAARQSTETASKGQLFSIASIPLIFLAGSVAPTFVPLENQILVPLQFLEFSRHNVAEADYLGVQYLYKTGYDPATAIRFLEKLQATEIVFGPFRTHPPIAERVEAMKTYIDLILPPRDSHIVTTPEFDRIKQRLAEIN